MFTILIRKGQHSVANNAIEHKLNELDWLRLDNTKYIVYGDTTAGEIYDRIKPVMNDDDTYVVLKATGEWKGWVSKTMKDWLHKDRD